MTQLGVYLAEFVKRCGVRVQGATDRLILPVPGQAAFAR